MTWIAAWGLTAIAAAVLGGILAGIKNRDYSQWSAWCFLFPPLVVWLLLLPRQAGPRPRRPTLDEEDRQPW